jgi:hypothetical protein
VVIKVHSDTSNYTQKKTSDDLIDAIRSAATKAAKSHPPLCASPWIKLDFSFDKAQAQTKEIDVQKEMVEEKIEPDLRKRTGKMGKDKMRQISEKIDWNAFNLQNGFDKIQNKLYRQQRKGKTIESMKRELEDKIAKQVCKLSLLTLVAEDKKQDMFNHALKNFVSLVADSCNTEYLTVHDEFFFSLVQLIKKDSLGTCEKMTQNADERMQLHIELNALKINRYIDNFPPVHQGYAECFFHAKRNLDRPEALSFYQDVQMIIASFSQAPTLTHSIQDLQHLIKSWETYDKIFTKEYTKNAESVKQFL